MMNNSISVMRLQSIVPTTVAFGDISTFTVEAPKSHIFAALLRVSSVLAGLRSPTRCGKERSAYDAHANVKQLMCTRDGHA